MDFNCDNNHKILDHLYLGNWNARHTKEFSLIVNCTDISYDHYNCEIVKLPIKDDPSEQDKYLDLIKASNVLEKIDQYRYNKKDVLIHCQAGAQRSPALVAMYLIKYFKLTPDEAIDYIRSKRPIAFFGHVNFGDMLDIYYRTLT
jgi:protein-tyrosine phosphatase